MIITIDGPVASGKSTIGRLLAKHLDAYYLYTGLLYRALAYILMREYSYDVASIAHPKKKDIDTILQKHRFEYQYNHVSGEQIWFDQENITSLLKNPTTDQAASILSTKTYVRKLLNMMQRNIAHHPIMVVDGRDAGSVVFPQAEYKFYLTADKIERAKRWQLQQSQKGNIVYFDQALLFLQERDERDAQRAIGPLIIPKKAHVVDTTGMNIDDVVASIITYIH